MVPRAGFEPTTLCLEGRCSIQLSYQGNMRQRREELGTSAREVKAATFLSTRQV